ncbi:MAG: hypothetical protein HY323_05355 [Betaproteobacteria bacterium]|nr:hypothetical protein [Betaproteobacteria bacterium]
MTSKLDTLSPLEREAHWHWLAGASHVHFGLCDICSRTHEPFAGYDKPLLVARQEHRRRFECFDCWEQPR